MMEVADAAAVMLFIKVEAAEVEALCDISIVPVPIFVATIVSEDKSDTLLEKDTSPVTVG